MPALIEDTKLALTSSEPDFLKQMVVQSNIPEVQPVKRSVSIKSEGFAGFERDEESEYVDVL